MLCLAQRDKVFRGVHLGRSGPYLTHFLFADDCMIFSDVTTEGATMIQSILDEYGRCSGQHVNFYKSFDLFQC